MDTSTLSLFEQLRLQIENASDPWPVVEQFEARLLAKFPLQSTEVIELMTLWLHRLGMIEADQLIGFV